MASPGATSGGERPSLGRRNRPRLGGVLETSEALLGWFKIYLEFDLGRVSA